MTKENQPNDGVKRSEGRFDPIEETRYWLPVTSEELCQKIARKRGLKLIEIVDTKMEPLPIICIYDNYPEDLTNE
jgi:hypothetical protein